MINRTVRSTWIASAAGLAAAACGGGQSSGGAVAAQTHTAKLGNAVVTYFGQPKPQFSSASGSVSVFGQAGATFSNVTLEPAPSLADTYLVFTRTNGTNNALYELPYSSGSQTTLLYQQENQAENPAISAYGAVAFTPAGNGLSTVRPDGTGLKQLSMGGLISIESPTFSVDGTNRLLFQNGGPFPGIYTAPGTGGTPTEIQTNASVSGYLAVGAGEAWNAAGNQIVFPVGQLNGSVYPTDLFKAAPTLNAAITDITPSALQGGLNFNQWPTWSPDGVTMAAQTNLGSGSKSVIVFNVNTGNYSTITPSTYQDQTPCFSPDGSKIAFYRDGTGGATPGIYVCDSYGQNQTLLEQTPAGFDDNLGISWSPFLPKETVVASSGSTFYHQAASGFLVGTVGSQIGSVVAFTAATPADAAVQAPSNVGNGAQLQFLLSADSITSIGYINNYFSPGTTITLTSTPSAMVSIDGTTGQVDVVAPSAVAKPSVQKNSDGTVTYNGPFKAVYDGKGKNLAPAGAAQVTVNRTTGKLVTFR